jgi:hypothetical protein
VLAARAPDAHAVGSKSFSAVDDTDVFFLLAPPTPQPQARLSYLGGSGVEGGQGSNDYNYGESTVLGPRSCARGQRLTLPCRATTAMHPRVPTACVKFTVVV